MNSVNDLMNSRRNFTKQRDNYLLAEDVYTVTSERYREGIASMTEVLQDEMSMSEAQNNYVTAHYDYRITNLTLLKAHRQARHAPEIGRHGGKKHVIHQTKTRQQYKNSPQWKPKTTKQSRQTH